MANIMIAIFEKAHTRGLSFLVPGRLSSRTTNNGLDAIGSKSRLHLTGETETVYHSIERSFIY